MRTVSTKYATARPAITEHRLDHLERQRKRLYVSQRGKCGTCGRIHRRHEDMELAHRVAETKTNIKVYGFERIDHDLNKVLVCRERFAGKDCNSSQNIANRPRTADRLMDEIGRLIGEVIPSPHLGGENALEGQEGASQAILEGGLR